MYLVSVIISAIVTLFTCYILSCKLSETKITTLLELKKVLIYILLNVVLVFNTIIFKDSNRIFINIFIIFLINFCIVFNYDYKKSIYYTLIYFLFSALCEVLSTTLSSLIFNFDVDDYNTMKFSMAIFSIFDSFLIILVSFIKKISEGINTLFCRLSNKTFIFMIFIITYIILLCLNNKRNWGYNINYYINLGMFIFIIVATLFVFQNTFKRINYENEYNILQRNLSMYEKEVNRQGKKNHEYNNQLMVLRGYIDNPKKLKEYLDLITEEHKGGQNYRIKQLGYLPDGGFKGLIYNKLALMEDNHIKSYLYVSSELKNLLEDIDIKYYSDLTKIFGVFIDNAIDATKDAKKKEIILDLKVDDNYLIIEISNTYAENTDLKKIGKKGYSSKGIGHGFGLSIVRDIKRSNEFIDTFNDIENDMFKQTIMAKIK